MNELSYSEKKRVLFIWYESLTSIGMYKEIKERINNHNLKVETLIKQYETEKWALASASSKVGIDTISKGIGGLTEVAVESSDWGRIGKKMSKASMDDQRKQSLIQLEERFHRLFLFKVGH